MEMQIDYAIYGKVIDKNPLIRFKSLEEAKDAYFVTENAMIVCEVSQIRPDGCLQIIQERIIKSPQIWLPADRFIPEFNDYYLCYLFRKEECGNITNRQDQVFFLNNNWSVLENEKVTHWMIVEDPKTKIKVF